MNKLKSSWSATMRTENTTADARLALATSVTSRDRRGDHRWGSWSYSYPWCIVRKLALSPPNLSQRVG